MSHKVHCLVALALLTLLVTGPASALPIGTRTPSASSVLSGAWDWFSSLVSVFWEKEGSQMDPNGPPSPGEAGSQMDPDGLNATGCTTEAGSGMDPDGRPIACPSSVG